LTDGSGGPQRRGSSATGCASEADPPDVPRTTTSAVLIPGVRAPSSPSVRLPALLPADGDTSHCIRPATLSGEDAIPLTSERHGRDAVSRYSVGALALLAALLGLAGAAPSARAAISSPNLILDGSGQSASCSGSGYDETTDPGWTITAGDPNVVCYTNNGGFPGSSTPGAQPGSGYFDGGTRGNGSLTQTANVSAATTAIDAGTATYNLSGWLGGFGKQNDTAALVATFQSATGAALGTSQIGPVTAADRLRRHPGRHPLRPGGPAVHLDRGRHHRRLRAGPLPDRQPAGPGSRAGRPRVDGARLRPRLRRLHGERELLSRQQHRRRWRGHHRQLRRALPEQRL
jgi:hypothetical protein